MDAATQAVDVPSSDAPSAGRPARRWWASSLAGTALGLLLAGLSTTPSLLPRPPVNQGLAAALSFAGGYLLAVSAVGLLRLLLPGRPIGIPSRARPWAWAVLAIVAVVAAVPLGSAWERTQGDLRVVAGEPPLEPSSRWIALGVAVVASIGLVLAGKAVAAVFRLLERRFAHHRSGAAASGLAVVSLAAVGVVVAVVVVASIGVVVQRSADEHSARSPAGVTEPSGDYRSVGPSSALSWDLAGYEGRSILAGGPSASEIAAVTGRPALEPIRIYAGVDEPGGWDEHAAAVVSELDRLGAADRDVVVVAATTGTGWLDREAIDAVEYLYGGSTVLATMQYSKAESWHSFVFHPEAYRDATSALLTAVGTWWRALPEASRPALYVYGLSLGSRAVQDSFPDAASMRAYGDGVVLAGTPYGTRMNIELAAARDAGSPVVLPVVDGGREFRWFPDGIGVAEALPSAEGWEKPRALYLQHGTDPIVWAGLPSVWSEPEWLQPGQRSASVHPEMRWIPVVTGIQLMLDTSVDLAVPDGIGHRYGSDTVEAWIAVAGDGGLSPDALDAVRQAVVGDDGLPAGGGV